MLITETRHSRPILTTDHQSFARRRSLAGLCVALMLGLLLAATASGLAQTVDNYEAERKRAFELFEGNNYVGALPILEKLAAANSSDILVAERLAFALMASAANLSDPGARKQVRLRARGFALRAKELGDESELLRTILNAIPEDGSEPPAYSTRKEVEEAMHEGEAAFVKGEMEKAIAAYGRALSLDPKQYEAALYTGDVYFKLKKMDKAGEWFARAVAINPDRETAYRYWSDALMGEGKMDEARAKFIDAILAEPYNRSPWAGLIQWAERKQVRLSHPLIETPSAVSVEKGKTNITLDASILGKKEPDGTESWLIYSITRALWINEKFAKEFPNEKEYRHSLREEAEALRLVAEAVSANLKQGKLKSKSLDPSIANLVKLNDAGLLEAYILLAKPDAGIARDYAAYRQANRDKLRRYLAEYVAAGK